MMDSKESIERIFCKITRSKQIHEAVLLAENLEGDFSIKNEYGGRNIHSPLLLASITKLFITACILILQEKNKLSLEDTLTVYFDERTLKGLHIFRGKEYSREITIANLLFQTSGLPDWFEEGGFKKLAVQKDFCVDFEEMLDKTKSLKSHFSPVFSRNAYYSDINFDLLGKVIERIMDMPLSEVFRTFLFAPLGLGKTYLPTNREDFIPPIYYKDELLHRPNFILSCYANGGAVSTAYELMRFLKAFFTGMYFSKDIFSRLSEYRKLQMTMGPIYYGGGYMQIPLASLNTFFMGKGELLGHSGTTGSFAFHYPEKELFLVGDLNQMKSPSLPIQTAMKLAMALKNFNEGL